MTTTNDKRLPFGSDSRVDLFLLLVVPVLVIFAAFHLNKISGPYWLNANLDPSYVYLMNALNVSNLHRPLHTDHPGTPVQVAGGVIIRLLNLTSDRDSTSRSVISNPERYLHIINNTLIILYAMCLLLAGYVALLVWQNILASIAVQSTPFLSLAIVVRFFGVTPETLLISISMLFVTLILLTLKIDVKTHALGYSLAFALLAGLGASCKFTFIPLLVIPVILLPSWKWRALFALSTIVAFLICIFPILTPAHFRNMFGFLFGIVTHTERYGGGETRIVDPQRYVSNVVSLVRGQSLVFIIGAAGLLALITNLKQRSWENSKYKALLAVSAAQVLQILMVARHPGSDRYLLPALSLAGLTLVLVIEAFSQKVCVALGRYRYAPATIACLIILFVQVQGMKRLYQDWEMETVLLSDVHEKLENDYKNALVVTYHGASSPYFALKAGEYYSGDYYGAILYELYPNQLFYDPWEGKFSNFQEAVEINALKTSDNWFLMHGWTFEAFEEPAALFQALPDKIALEKTYRKGEYRNWEPQRSDRSLYIGREVIYKATIRY